MNEKLEESGSQHPDMVSRDNTGQSTTKQSEWGFPLYSTGYPLRSPIQKEQPHSIYAV